MSHSPCQSLFHAVRCTLRCQGVVLHACRCGRTASWITNPPRRCPPTSLHPHHTVLRSLGRQLCCWGLAGIAQRREFKRPSPRQRLKLSSHLLMTVVSNIPHKRCVILSCALASGLPVPLGTTTRGTADSNCRCTLFTSASLLSPVSETEV